MSITVLFKEVNNLTDEIIEEASPIPVTFTETSEEFFIKLAKTGTITYGSFIDNITSYGTDFITLSLSNTGLLSIQRPPDLNSSYKFYDPYITKYRAIENENVNLTIRQGLNYIKKDIAIFFEITLFVNNIQFSEIKIETYNALTTVSTVEDIPLKLSQFSGTIKDIARSLSHSIYFIAFPGDRKIVIDNGLNGTNTSYGIVPCSVCHKEQYNIDRGTSGYRYGSGSSWTSFRNHSAYEILIIGYVIEFPSSSTDFIVGDYNNNSEEGAFPELPEQSAVRSGMVRLFQMSTEQLNAFSNFLWNTDYTDLQTIIDTLKQWFVNPLDCIVGLSISPIDLFYNYETKEQIVPVAEDITLAGISTGCQGYKCVNNLIKISLGKLNLKPYYNSFLDCNPATKWQIFLPYIGFRDLDANELFSTGGCAIEVIYYVDIITGVCTANIMLEKTSNGTHLKHILYAFTGNMNTTIPITSTNLHDMISSIITGSLSIGTMIASGGATTPMVLGAIGTANSVASTKANIQKGGNLSLESGIFGSQYAYLIVTRPREARPELYKELSAIPSQIGGTLGNFTGFTVVQEVHIDKMSATEEEKEQIENILKNGIIL